MRILNLYPLVDRLHVAVAEWWNFRAGDMRNCNRWSQHAIAVSPFSEDDGVLERTVCRIPSVRSHMKLMGF